DAPRRHRLDKFWWKGLCPFAEHQQVLQVTREPDGRRMVTRPGTVVHLEPWPRRGRRRVTFVYLERPKGRRVLLQQLRARIGAKGVRRLGRGGEASRAWKDLFLRAWPQ